MGGQNGEVEKVVARLATGAHGVVSRRELLAADLSERQINGRVERGVLIVEFPGVYRVGHRAPNIEARYVAALKACGEGAVLSGLAAAWLYGLVGGRAPRPEVTTPKNRRVKGVLTHRSLRLDPRETTIWKRIPVTTVPRTIVDLPSLLSFDDLTKAVHEADVRHGTRPEHIESVLARYPNAPGAATLRAIAGGDAPTLLSELEKRFRALLEKHRLPVPDTNRKRGAHYVDCRSPELRLTIELDSYRFHRSRHAWEQDHQRERSARARGDDFRRYTWRHIVEEPADTVTELRTLLRRP
jgi:very-short-patch-repair endonuclease